MSKLKVIDLFAGCGGLSLGFKKTGYDVLGHVEIDNDCCKTLSENSSAKETILEIDITNNKECFDLLRSADIKEIDGIIGGPPCQAYSIAGRNKEENKMDEDPRNFLFESFNYLSSTRLNFPKRSYINKISPKFYGGCEIDIYNASKLAGEALCPKAMFLMLK